AAAGQRVQAVVEQLLPAFAPLAETGQAVFGALAGLLAALSDAFANLVQATLPVIDALGRVLVPVLEGLTVVIDSLSSVINSHTVALFAAYQTYNLVSNAVLGFVAIVPKIVAAIKAIMAAVDALNVALVIENALSGPEGWAALAAGIIAAG